MNTGDAPCAQDGRDGRHRINELYDAFSYDWKNGRVARIEDVLARVSEPERPALFRDLLALELHYRRERGESPTPEQYLTRFPAHREAVEKAFEETFAGDPVPPASPGTPHERFPSGAVLAGRYRIVAPLGKGGMGEVYRADDLTLGQPVALKFLPAHIAHDPDRSARLRKEVALARKVRHPNVCAVYDIDEHDGQSFLKMEFIDGGDLSAALKRFGRMTETKGIEIARQLCSALVAVHDEGLLHRDLKPANVMLDGSGEVRLTDFGLAEAAEDLSAADARSGTRPYQAPEQLSGKGVTARSDVYALGLVFYELFTDRRAFVDEKRERAPDKPSTHVPDLNPAIEDVILKCLEPEPENRPQSANEVLHRLLAIGQTPTPEEVVRIPGAGRFTRRTGLALFALAVAGAFGAAWLNDFASLFRPALTDQTPRGLSRRAQEHLRALGYDDPARDSAHAFATDEKLLNHLRDERPEAFDRAALAAGRFPVMYFWYRRSDDVLAQRLAPNDTSGWSMPGRVLPNEPPLREPGMTCVFLDTGGRLLEFHAVPSAQAHAAPVTEPDPAPLLAAAGFAPGSLRESQDLRRVPPGFADRRMAWEGTFPNAPEMPVRVEAAFFRGKPVYFHIGVDGHSDRLPGFMPENRMEKLQEVKNTLLGLVALPIGGWFAWRNWRSKPRRANPRGAALLAGCFVALGMAGWLLAAKHAVWPNDRLAAFKDELSMFTGMLGRVLFDGLLLWLAYLALEPWVRRVGPERVNSWNRLLLGKWSDPLVGRDVLIGGTTAAVFVALLLLLRASPACFGYTPDPKIVWDATFTEGAGGLLLTAQIALMVALRSFFLYFLAVLVCRGRAWPAAGLNVAVWWALYAHGGDYRAVSCLVGLAFAAASLFVLLRAGLLGFVVFNLVEQVLVYLPVTTDFSAWYTGISSLSLLLVVGLSACGFWAACRRPGY